MKEMACGGSPAGIGEFPPHFKGRLALAFRQVHKPVARERDRRESISLGTQLSLVLLSPRFHGLEEVIIGHLCERSAPIIANCGGIRSSIHDEREQMRTKIITPSPLKLLKERRTPVGSVIFQAVAENGVGWLVAECREKDIANCVKVIFGGRAVVVIEDKTCRRDRRPLDDHARSAGDKADQLPLLGG